jgi:hypothetical protein
MSDGDMHAFLMHSLGIENCESTAQQLFNAAKETLLWADVRIELKLSAPSAMDLRTALLEAIKAATMGNSGGRSAAAPSGCVPEGPAAEFVNGVPTTDDDDDARYHPASGKYPASGTHPLSDILRNPCRTMEGDCTCSVRGTRQCPMGHTKVSRFSTPCSCTPRHLVCRRRPTAASTSARSSRRKRPRSKEPVRVGSPNQQVV